MGLHRRGAGRLTANTDTGRRVENGYTSGFLEFSPMPLACPVCTLPIDACAMTMTGQIDGDHFITAFCSRCAKRLATLPEPARRRLCLVAERRIAKAPQRYPVRVCASEFEARALQALADDPATFEQVHGIIIGEE